MKIIKVEGTTLVSITTDEPGNHEYVRYSADSWYWYYPLGGSWEPLYNKAQELELEALYQEHRSGFRPVPVEVDHRICQTCAWLVDNPHPIYPYDAPYCCINPQCGSVLFIRDVATTKCGMLHWTKKGGLEP